jgi:multicomponent Na+:H+ antiporter subunit G
MIAAVFTLFVALLVILAAVVSLVAAIGLLRLPDLFTRMHAVSKAGTAGSGLALVAVALHSAELAVVIKSLAAIVFIVLTTPISAHLLARAQWKRHGRSGHVDDD